MLFRAAEDGLGFDVSSSPPQVICRDPESSPARPTAQPQDTRVTVKLFDSAPMNFTVSGDIPWSDAKFSEVVAQAALDRYRESAV